MKEKNKAKESSRRQLELERRRRVLSKFAKQLLTSSTVDPQDMRSSTSTLPKNIQKKCTQPAMMEELMLTAKVSVVGVEKLMAADVCKKLSELEVGTVIEAMEAEVRPSKFGEYVTIKGNQLLRPSG